LAGSRRLHRDHPSQPAGVDLFPSRALRLYRHRRIHAHPSSSVAPDGALNFYPVDEYAASTATITGMVKAGWRRHLNSSRHEKAHLYFVARIS